MSKPKDNSQSTSSASRGYKAKRLVAEASAKRSRRDKMGDALPDIVIDFRHSDARPVKNIMRFGTVTVVGTKPDPDTVARNIGAGHEALSRAADAFLIPGVQLKIRQGVPLFRADAKNPGVLIRELDGLLDRGSIVGGKFVPAK